MTAGAAADRAGYTEALIDLTGDRDYDAVTVEEIAAAAGGGRPDFEVHFGSKLECAAAALEELAASNLQAVRTAYESSPPWPDSLRAAAYAHVKWIEENPEKMRFGLLETLWAGELTSALRDHLFGSYVAMIDAGREVAADPASVPAYTAESAVGSITQVVVRSLGRPGDLDLSSLVPEMMYLAVRPYLGEEAARRELAMPSPIAGADGRR